MSKSVVRVLRYRCIVFRKISRGRSLRAGLSTGLLHERSAKLHKQLCSNNFKAQLKSFSEDLPWEKFKSWPPEDYDQFDRIRESVELRRASKAEIL